MSILLDHRGNPYNAAQFNRFTSHLRSVCQTSVEDLRLGVLSVIRARSRDLYNNAAIAHGLINTIVRRVVGAGLTVLPELTSAEGRLRDENLALRSLWMEYQRDISTRGHKGHKFWKLVLRTFLRDGEGFAVQTDEPNLPFSLRWQLLEGDQLPEKCEEGTFSLYKGVEAGNKVEMGIEMTRSGRAVAYHFYDDGGDMWSLDIATRKMRRVPAERVLHWSNGSRFGSPRGVPILTPVMLLLADDEEFRKAVLTKAWAQACLTAFVSGKSPDMARDALGAEVTTATENNLDGTQRTVTLSNVPLTYGSIFSLPDDTEVKMVASTAPPQNMAEFTEVILHAIAAGTGLSYQLLSRSLKGVSYSGGRQGDNEDRLAFADISREMDEEIIEPIWRKWNDYVYDVLRLRDDPGAIDRYAVKVYHPQPREIDPVKQRAANRLALEHGETSLIRVCAESGESFYDIADEIAESRAYAAERGIDLTYTPVPITINEKDDDDDAEES